MWSRLKLSRASSKKAEVAQAEEGASKQVLPKGLVLDYGSGRFWWPLNERLEAGQDFKDSSLATAGLYLSFTEEDYEAKVSESQAEAKEDLMAQAGGAVKTIKVNHGKAKSEALQSACGNWLYAASHERLIEFKKQDIQLVPGAALMRHMLAQVQSPGVEYPLIAGLRIKGNPYQLMVLMVCTSAGDFIKREWLPIEPQNEDEAIGSFAQSARLSASGRIDPSRIHIFDLEDCIKEYKRLNSYAAPLWAKLNLNAGFGIGKAAWRRSMQASVLLAGLAAVGSMYLHFEAESKRNEESFAQRQISAMDKRITESIQEDRYGGFLALGAVDYVRMLDLSREVWHNGANIKSQVSQQEIVIDAVYRSPSLLDSFRFEDVLTSEPPQGCKKDAERFDRGLNRLELKYVCKVDDGLFQRINAFFGVSGGGAAVRGNRNPGQANRR